jgi:hypothetical protein
MTRADQERADLARAERHLAAGEARIAAQRALIARMTDQGHDTTAEQELLRQLEETQAQWHCHRQLILEAIARAEGR